MPSLTNVNDNNVASVLLKKVISPRLNKAYPTKTVFLSEMTRNAQDRKAAGAEDVHFDFNNNQIYFDMSASPLVPMGSGYKDAINIDAASLYAFNITALPLYVAAEVPDFTDAITNQDRGAIIKIFSVLQEAMRDGAKLSLNRMMNSDGTNTVSLTSSSGSATQTVPVTLDADRKGTRYLKKNMWITIQGATGGSKNGGQTTQITSISYSAQTITVADPMTFASAAIINYATQTGGPVTDWVGIPALIVTTGTVEGQDITQVPYQIPYTYTTSGPFDPNQILTLDTSPETGNSNLYLTNLTGWNKGTQSVIGAERTGMGNQAYLDMGYRTFTANAGQTDVVLDRDTVASTYWLIDKSSLRYGELQPFGPFGMGGGLMWIPDYPMMIAQMRMSGNMGIVRIEANQKYSNFT